MWSSFQFLHTSKMLANTKKGKKQKKEEKVGTFLDSVLTWFKGENTLMSFETHYFEQKRTSYPL